MKGSQYIQKSIKPPSNVRHFDNGRLFSAFKKVLLELCSPSESLFSFLFVLIWEALNIINRSAQLPPATSRSFLQTQSARGVDHSSLHSRWSWGLKTNMPLWYHLICSAPLSAKISFIPPTVATHTPPSEPDVLPPSVPFEVKACALRQRVNVSHCYGVTGLHSRLFDPVLGLKSFFKKKNKKKQQPGNIIWVERVRRPTLSPFISF